LINLFYNHQSFNKERVFEREREKKCEHEVKARSVVRFQLRRAKIESAALKKRDKREKRKESRTSTKLPTGLRRRNSQSRSSAP